MDTAQGGLLFGVYPGGATGDDEGGLAVGPPDEPDRISAALDRLQGAPERPFLVRAYLGFTDTTPAGGPHPTEAPADAARYAVRGRSLDLVAQYRSASGDIEGYCRYLRELVGQYGEVTGTFQVAEEPNVTTNPNLDGHYPDVADAIVRGVAAARAEARRLGYGHLRFGFNTTPLFGPSASFVADLVRHGGDEFVAQLDYVGLDFFPDVFRPVAADEFADAVAGLLRYHRETVLAPAGLGHLPLHITEHGWPTGPDRSPERQAEVVDTVVRTLAEHTEELRPVPQRFRASPVRGPEGAPYHAPAHEPRTMSLSGYTHFALRDADSARPGLFHQFGLLRDDYTPKPAFDTYRALVEKFGG